MRILKKKFTIITFVLFLSLLFDRFCFFSKESMLLRCFHACGDLVYYASILILMYEAASQYLKKEENLTFLDFVVSFVWAHFVARCAQVIAYFCSHLFYMPFNELFPYCIKRIFSFLSYGYLYRPYVPWKMTLLEGLILFKNVLLMVMNRAFKVVVCVVAYIENKSSNKSLEKRQKVYGLIFILIYSLYLLFLI